MFCAKNIYRLQHELVEVLHGYKNHIEIDNKHKLIRKAIITTASTHDSQEINALLDNGNADNDVWADSAYRSCETEKKLSSQGLTSHINERAYRNTPLTKEQKSANRVRSK